MQQHLNRIWGALLFPTLFAVFFSAAELQAQTTGRLRFDLSIGMHAFFLPGAGATFSHPQPIMQMGVFRTVGNRQHFQMGINLGYQRNKYQGDGLYAQAQLRYQPVVWGHLEPGIAVGAGYQMAFSPSRQLTWNGETWEQGRRFKGVFQAPVRLSLGYRGIHSPAGIFTPYLACQTHILTGYSPDLSPFPVTAFLGGFTFSPAKK